MENEAPARKERGAITVYQALREEILTLAREPGSALDEMSIAKAFNMSRTPVREAIFMLSGEGLVRVLPNRSSIVSPLSMHRMNDLLDTWLILTRAVLIDAAHRRTPADVANLRARCDAFAATTESGDQMKIATALLELQLEYRVVARNFFLAWFYPQILDAGRRTLLLHYFPYATPEDLAYQVKAHTAIIDAVEREDIAACNRIAGEKIADVLRVIKTSLEPSIADDVDLSTAPLS
ncbi:GntR family transcriptional regulator [Pelagovum pacificum]|uniref:GntR family transcriptional regulator n=1 Tax=Pelagovum pacificum TaxID=2588711 RepID=A0A5C5GFK8_9RHOB|nr:GntR family transcriptional regulator [Pelagovum pacificum]QQA43573.1 GntR family transcriptional regulator [Pelagovum pacificum]TNY33290.1 GntR family transcriptional regulator [Pelagovum pacificum]